MDFSKVLQLIASEGIRAGNRYQWANWFPVDQELLDEANKPTNKELEEL